MTRRALVAAIGEFADQSATADDPARIEPFARLEFAERAAYDIARSLRRLGFECEDPLLNVSQNDFDEAITSVTRGSAQAALVYFIGHGAVWADADRYYLVARDTDPTALGGTGVDICGHLDMINGGRENWPPVLFMLDACHSGRAVRHVLGQRLIDRNRKAWVLAATNPGESALSGRFSSAAAYVFNHIASGTQDIDNTEEFIYLELLLQLLQKKMDLALPPGVPRQEVLCTRPSVDATNLPTPPFFANPHFDPKVKAARRQREALVPEASVRAVLDEVADPEHFRVRASGILNPQRGNGLSRRCLFSGRSDILAPLVAWLDQSQAQRGTLRVVTGSPGSGKSALLGVLACAIHPGLLAVAPEVSSRLTGPLHPVLQDRIAIIHARNRNSAEILGSLARQLQIAEQPPEDWTIETLAKTLSTQPGPHRRSSLTRWMRHIGQVASWRTYCT